ncbi:MAG: hypothetical protein WC284_07535 [Candidimonas sp.]|jgi:hypothetical protein
MSPLTSSPTLRKECPPGACVCDRQRLLATPDADIRVLLLTKDQEKRLIARIEAISDYEDLLHVRDLIYKQLGVTLRITPSEHGVRTVMGLAIKLDERPGLCSKTRQTIPAAVRRCLSGKPDIVYAILNAHDLLAGS